MQSWQVEKNRACVANKRAGTFGGGGGVGVGGRRGEGAAGMI